MRFLTLHRPRRVGRGPARVVGEPARVVGEPARVVGEPARVVGEPARVVGEPAQERVATLVALTYELLDAHADTARLASDVAGGVDWRHHLAYLRDLQRVGREALARV